jgi:DNA-binding NarL/FixJ family response regulator
MTRFESMLTVVAFLLVMAGVLVLVSIYAKTIAAPFARLPVTRPRRVSRKPPEDKGLNLTDREREVAKLAAAGMTSRQIAEALKLSVREVEGCLRNPFRKGQGE